MTTLPAGWETADLQDVTADISYGFTTSSVLNGSGPKLLRITDIQNGNVDWSTVPHCVDTPHASFLLQAGDVVIARTGATTGKSFLVEKLACPTAFASYLIRVRFANEVGPKYPYAFMQSRDYWSQIQIVSKGTAQPGANAQLLSRLQFPIAPFKEQRRIVAKIDSLSAKSKRARDNLNHIFRLVEKYKQSILAAAFRGELTSEKTLRKALGEVCRIKSGFAFRSSDFRSTGDVPVVRIGDISGGEIIFIDGSKFLNQSFLSTASDFVVKRGDILVALSGATTGKSGVYKLERPAFLNQRVARLRPDEPFSPEAQLIAFFVRWISDEILGAAYGGAQPNISPEKLAAFELEWPSRRGCVEIIGKLQAAFAWIDRLASEATCARRLIDHLDQAVLAKAFQGELLPQDPNDEPANVLLERIRAEREATRTLRGRNAEERAIKPKRRARRKH